MADSFGIYSPSPLQVWWSPSYVGHIHLLKLARTKFLKTQRSHNLYSRISIQSMISTKSKIFFKNWIFQICKSAKSAPALATAPEARLAPGWDRQWGRRKGDYQSHFNHNNHHWYQSHQHHQHHHSSSDRGGQQDLSDQKQQFAKSLDQLQEEHEQRLLNCDFCPEKFFNKAAFAVHCLTHQVLNCPFLLFVKCYFKWP